MSQKMKQGIIVFSILVLLGTVFLFREKIFSLFGFNLRNIPASNENVVVPPETVDAAAKETMLEPSFISPPPPLVILPYAGRDPAEIRPVPEEVKLFSEEQKRTLYATLETHGRSVKADPKYFNGWIQVGILKKTIGDFIGARDAWEYAGIIQPLNSTSFANLGELYWRYLHEYQKAEENFRIAIKNKAQDPLTYVSLADLYHYSYVEKADFADDVLLEGLEESPGNENLIRRLAFLYEQRKDYTNALLWWKKILELNPDDQSVVESIERLKGKE